MSVEYDYENGLIRLKEILDSTDEVKEVKRLPNDSSFTYSNGYKSWATAIFVDIRESTNLFSNENELDVAKTIRGFTSEIIEILKKETDNSPLKEIGIRGDCVYAIYSTPYTGGMHDVYDRAAYINTYMKMLNKELQKRNLPLIKAGIGIGASKTVAVKAGRSNSGISNLVWIGKAVSKAAKLANLGNKDGRRPIVLGSVAYQNIMEYIDSIDSNGDVIEKFKSFWIKEEDYYHGNVIYTQFDSFIEEM